MYRARSTQIARLEKLAVPYIAKKSAMNDRWRDIRQGAVAHATVLAFLIRYGKPKSGEPLSEACQRVTESEIWKAFRDKFFPTPKPPHPNYPVRRGRSFDPYSRDNVFVMGRRLRHVVISRFPGVDEQAKLSAVFKAAPLWLLWFTFADYTAAVLGLELRDLSSISRFARSREVFDTWWGLPRDAFLRRPWPTSLVQDPLSRTDLSLLGAEPAHQELTTGRERKRLSTSGKASSTDRWPPLIPEEFFLMDPKQRSVFEEKKHPLFEGKIF
jgi:hypothetical protein